MTECIKLHISHQMRPYSSVKAIQGSSYTCFGVLEHWGNSGEFDSNTLNYGEGYTESYPKCSNPHFTSNEALVE